MIPGSPLVGDPPGGGLVAGQHDDPDPGGVQRGQRGGHGVFGFAFHVPRSTAAVNANNSCSSMPSVMKSVTAGSPFGQGAGLVHHLGVDPSGGFQRGGVLEQHPGFSRRGRFRS